MPEQAVTVEADVKELPARCMHPTAPYDRTEFYQTTDNVRYMLKLNMTNGQQATDVPIGIEELVEFAGEVEAIIDSSPSLSVLHREHSHWVVKLNTDASAPMKKVDWRTIEDDIETAAEDYDIALEKSVSMSGRGYQDRGYRCVGVSYSFGSQRTDAEDFITDDKNPLSKIEWVGGYRGRPDDLQPSTIRVTSVETKEPSFWWHLKKMLGLT